MDSHESSQYWKMRRRIKNYVNDYVGELNTDREKEIALMVREICLHELDEFLTTYGDHGKES